LTLEDFVAVSVEEAQEQLMQVGVEHCLAEQVAKVAEVARLQMEVEVVQQLGMEQEMVMQQMEALFL